MASIPTPDPQPSLLDTLFEQDRINIPNKLVQTAAALSGLIYGQSNESESPEQLERTFFIDADIKKNQLSKFAGFYSEVDMAYFLVWKGTTDPLDWLQDASFVSVPLHSSGLRVHSGIHALLSRNIEDHLPELKERLKKIDSGEMDVDHIILTGHSLGGGSAMLAMAELLLALAGRSPHMDQDELEHVKGKIRAVTFAAPMVFASRTGTHSEKNEIELALENNCINFVNGNDMVPRLPGSVDYIKNNMHTLGGLARNWPAQLVAGFAVKKIEPRLNKLIEAHRPECETYHHLCSLIHLKPTGSCVCSGEDLLTFDDLLDRETKGSMVLHHAVDGYVEAVHDAGTTRADGVDYPNCIAGLGWEKVQSFWDWLWRRENYNDRFVFRPQKDNIRQLSRTMGSRDQPMSVISFSGNSISGKSFIIRNLQGDDYPQRPWAFPPGQVTEGSTTGDVNLFESSFAALMDCEGTNGTDVPTTMGKIYRKINDKIGCKDNLKRAEAVKNYLPTFALLTSSIFCYVTVEDTLNITAYQEVLAYARKAWENIQTTSRPCLVVIQNKVYPTELKSFTESTRSFKKHDVSKDLGSFFSTIDCVQLPRSDEGYILNQQTRESAADLFRKKIPELEALFKNRLRRRESMLQGDWLKMVGPICDNMNTNNPVNMARVIDRLLFANKFSSTVSDVTTVFSNLMSPRHMGFLNKDELIEKIKDALALASQHASRLMARHIFVENMCDPPLKASAVKELFSEELDSLESQIRRLVPCCSLADPHGDLSEAQRICAQPAGCHEVHRAMCKYSSPVRHPIWGRPNVSHTWEGRHIIDDEIISLLDSLVEDICRQTEVAVAERCAGVACLADDIREERAEIPRSLEGKVRPCLNRKELAACYLCARTMELPLPLSESSSLGQSVGGLVRNLRAGATALAAELAGRSDYVVDVCMDCASLAGIH